MHDSPRAPEVDKEVGWRDLCTTTLNKVLYNTTQCGKAKRSLWRLLLLLRIGRRMNKSSAGKMYERQQQETAIKVCDKSPIRLCIGEKVAGIVRSVPF